MTRSSAPRVVGALLGFVGLSTVAGLLAALLVVPSIAVAGEGVVTAADTFNALPSFLKITQPAQSSSIYAKKNGKNVKLATFYVQNRTDVSLAEMSPWVARSAIATEDPRFFEEGAIDLQGTIRGALSTSIGHSVQGGSSITQQYVKNVLVQRCAQENDGTSKKAVAAATKCYEEVTATTPARKLREMRYAIGVQKRYSKHDILRSYLNIVGFGGTVYGIQAAAEYYFGVPAKNLSLVQAATLTAIINNPSNLRIDHPSNKDNGSANHYAKTKDRRDYVLTRMQKEGKITVAQRDKAIATAVRPKITPQANGCATAVKYDAGYFCKYVELSMINDKAFGKTSAERIEKLTEGGLKVYTTLNLDLQAKAQAAVSASMPASVPGLNVGASNVAVEPGTGRIVTMVQNTKFDETASASAGTTSVNYNTDHNRGGSQGFQTGSSFKAFTLAAWLEAGHTLNESVNTTEHALPFSEFTNSCYGLGNEVWNVANAEAAPASMTVLLATEESINTAYAAMGRKLDLCNIQKTAFNMGIHAADPDANPFTSPPSMILGTNYIAPLTMATAYAGIANHGVVCTPVSITRIEGADGKRIAPTATKCTQGMSTDVADGVAYALQTVLKPGGTAASANPGDGVPIIAKTGTTDGAVQNWLVTSTSKIAQATWVGNISGSAGFYKTYINGQYGYGLKFTMDKTIIADLNAAYPGAAQFPAPPQSEIGVVAKPKPAATNDSKDGAAGTDKKTNDTGNADRGNPGKGNPDKGKGKN
ncbi:MULTISPECIES: transglycosylase domain-containing protein [unclassified Frondihabitans]|uniref:transglycosylase domain-containing protein n=1 Tax=unclassified Frondihabitans TaxID=2626248 RepID=UPI000F505E47|nr:MULTISPECIES: transglycosylase domain-containing protein [unclassified Frondihabitans]RPE78593.1 membrane peptidoglycan carboxypeptidase [Frondihabitans sp. PhB153]RPF08874.1 membrane peptidoglycan carboxypeptidase [Frondihabitans sp. PhB161]